VNLPKKGLLVLAAVIALGWILFLPLALGAMAGFPFALWEDDEVEPVGARATFRESVDCLTQYRHYSSEPDRGPRLDSKAIAVCFPPQRAAQQKALIACFNGYVRSHPEGLGWPEDNLRVCTWDGLNDTPAPFAFGEAVAVPAVPRAGEGFVLAVDVAGSDPAGEDVNAAIGSGNLEIDAKLDDNGSTTPLDTEYRLEADGKITVKLSVPESAEGQRLIITLTIEPDRRDGVKIVELPVGQQDA
jgi:hypothetical protein